MIRTIVLSLILTGTAMLANPAIAKPSTPTKTLQSDR
jgi:hypothetical protein